MNDTLKEFKSMNPDLRYSEGTYKPKLKPCAYCGLSSRENVHQHCGDQLLKENNPVVYVTKSGQSVTLSQVRRLKANARKGAQDRYLSGDLPPFMYR